MGAGSTIAIKAMLAAKAQGKYEQLQKAIFTSDSLSLYMSLDAKDKIETFLFKPYEQ